MLLITKLPPSHCTKSPATDAVATNSNLPVVSLNTILLEDEEPLTAVDCILNDEVTADALTELNTTFDVVLKLAVNVFKDAVDAATAVNLVSIEPVYVASVASFVI
jgi:hypothetical protein